jgi:hypothetical protein
MTIGFMDGIDDRDGYPFGTDDDENTEPEGPTGERLDSIEPDSDHDLFDGDDDE